MNSAHPPGAVYLRVIVEEERFRDRTGFGMDLLKALPLQPRPVSDGIAHEAAVNVVERLMVSPVILDVVDFEVNVRGYPAADVS